MALNSEDDLLALIDHFFPRRGPGVILGRGDDAAVLDLPGPVCFSLDLFIEGEHFRRDWASPEEAGYKALAVNLSDLAGMGAEVLAFGLGVIVPRPADEVFWRGFLQSMAELAATHSLPLVGGDIVAGPAAGAAVSIWGGQVPGGRFLTRLGPAPTLPAALEELRLFVLGRPGLSRIGLHALQVLGRSQAKTRYPQALTSHLRPAIYLKPAQQFAQGHTVMAMMDLSDGLARDLPRLLGPDLGAELELTESMLHPEVIAFCRAHGLEALDEAVLGGEEYGLLGLGLASDLLDRQKTWPDLLIIGRVSGQPGLRLNGRPFTRSGFDHFGPV